MCLIISNNTPWYYWWKILQHILINTEILFGSSEEWLTLTVADYFGYHWTLFLDFGCRKQNIRILQEIGNFASQKEFQCRSRGPNTAVSTHCVDICNRRDLKLKTKTNFNTKWRYLSSGQANIVWNYLQI